MMNLFSIKNDYVFQGMVYLDEYNRPTQDITDKVKWLDRFTFHDFTEKRATKKAHEFFNNMYPQYKDMIWLL